MRSTRRARIRPTCKAFRHGAPFEGRRGPARISRTGATLRKVRMAWSILRDGGEPSPSILDECSRPRGRGATFSLNGCSLRSAEVRRNQSSSPSCFRTDLNRTLLLATRGITPTLAGPGAPWPHRGVAVDKSDAVSLDTVYTVITMMAAKGAGHARQGDEAPNDDRVTRVDGPKKEHRVAH